VTLLGVPIIIVEPTTALILLSNFISFLPTSIGSVVATTSVIIFIYGFLICSISELELLIIFLASATAI